MNRINEMKIIMRKLKEIKNESVDSEGVTVEASEEIINEAELPAESEEMSDVEENHVDTENDASAKDMYIARLADLVSRIEKVLEPAEKAAEEAEPEEAEPAEEEAEAEEAEPEAEPEEAEPAEEEAEAEESYQRSLEKRIADLERRFTESRRRNLCKRFSR
jgi:cell division septation protein DedD